MIENSQKRASSSGVDNKDPTRTTILQVTPICTWDKIQVFLILHDTVLTDTRAYWHRVLASHSSIIAVTMQSESRITKFTGFG